jgi:hypothetical protein
MERGKFLIRREQRVLPRNAFLIKLCQPLPSTCYLLSRNFNFDLGKTIILSNLPHFTFYGAYNKDAILYGS